MKFDAANGDYGVVRDRNGLILHYPVSGDTETGIVVCMATDNQGNFILAPGQQGTLLRETRLYRSPLSISPIPTGWCQPNDSRKLAVGIVLKDGNNDND